MRARDAAFGGVGLVVGLVVGATLASGPGPEPGDARHAPAIDASRIDADGGTDRPAGPPPAAKRARRPGAPAPRDLPGRRVGPGPRDPSSAGPPPPESSDRPVPDEQAAPGPPAAPPGDGTAPDAILSLAEILEMSRLDGDLRAVQRAFHAWDEGARWDLLRRLADGLAEDLAARPVAVEAAVWSVNDAFDPDEDPAAAATMARVARYLASRDDEYVRLVAVDAAVLSGRPGLDVATTLAAHDPSPRVRSYALDEFETWEEDLTDEARAAILDNLDADDGALRWEAVENLPLAGPRAGEPALRLLREGGLPADLLPPVAAAIVVADAVPEALAASREPEALGALAEAIADRIEDGTAGRRWDPAIFEAAVPADALEYLVDSVGDFLGPPALARIFADAGSRPAARVRAFDGWIGREEHAADAVTAGLRVLRDAATPAALRQELPWRLVAATALPDEADPARPGAEVRRAQVVRALREVAARDANRWVRDAAREALEDVDGE